MDLYYVILKVMSKIHEKRPFLQRSTPHYYDIGPFAMVFFGHIIAESAVNNRMDRYIIYIPYNMPECNVF